MHERRRSRSGLRTDCSDDEVVFPRPRRVGATACVVDGSKGRRRRSISSRCDVEAGREILEIFLRKNGFPDGGLQGCSPPPFLASSPPSRAGNPVVNDVRFTHEKSMRGTSAAASPCQNLFVTCTPVRASPSIRVEGFFSPVKAVEGRCQTPIRFA